MLVKWNICYAILHIKENTLPYTIMYTVIMLMCFINCICITNFILFNWNFNV